jgi:glucose 1-dehydrogenase
MVPGAIITPINKFVLDDSSTGTRSESEIALGRTGNAQEIAAAVAWAASEQASHVIGTTSVVDGGISLCPGFV